MSRCVLWCLIWANAVTFAGGAPADPLWQKALAVARTNSDWVAGLVIMRSEVLHKGETNGVHELWQRSSLGSNGKVVTRTIKVLEDGEDVTAQERKKEEKNKKKKAESNATANPFDPEIQDRLSLAATNRSRVIAGKECAGYAFEVRNTKGPTIRGMAWVEKATGIPIEIENMTLDPLPDKHLKQMAITTCYESTASGEWRVKEVLVTGSVSVMFIHADIRSTTTFSEYWKRPAPTKTTLGKDEN